jgi:hypothetical protein
VRGGGGGAPLCGGGGPLLFMVVACDPVGPIDLVGSDASMTLFLVVDPDTSSQPLLVESFAPNLRLDSLAVRTTIDGAPADSAIAASDTSFSSQTDWIDECIHRYGSLSPRSVDWRCPVLAESPAYGSEFHIEVSGAGRPTASATIRVPGDFRILSASAEGDPPQTLDVVWARSDGAYRYMVGLHPAHVPGCRGGVPDQTNEVGWLPCRRSWLVATADTVEHTTVPADAITGGEGPWQVEVFALDRPLYDYVTTGTSGDYFSVPPIQNVAGGYGVVGAWVWRRMDIVP